MADGWTIRDRSEVFRARRWSVERSVRSRVGASGGAGGGGGGEHEFHTIRIADFVHVIACTAARELVMVRQFRHGVEEPTLEMPGGLVDASEADVLAAARRELLEETGYEGLMTPLGWVWPNPALMGNRCSFFVAEGAERVSGQALEETEDAEVVLVPEREIEPMIERGAIANALMLAGILRWRVWERARRG